MKENTSDPTYKGTRRLVDIKKWWLENKADIMAEIYWYKGQVPPQDPKDREEAWQTILAWLKNKFPPTDEEYQQFLSKNENKKLDKFRKLVREMILSELGPNDPIAMKVRAATHKTRVDKANHQQSLKNDRKARS